MYRCDQLHCEALNGEQSSGSRSLCGRRAPRDDDSSRGAKGLQSFAGRLNRCRRPLRLARIVHKVFAIVAALVLVLATTIAPGESNCATGATIAKCRIGFENHFKVGYWTPVFVEVAGAQAGDSLKIELSTVDSDGVETVIPSSLELSGSPGQRESSHTHTLYAKIGRPASPLHVALFKDETEIDRLTLRPSSTVNQPALDALPATSELIVSCGGSRNGLLESLPERQTEDGQTARRVVDLVDVRSLPDAWFGYESVDLFVLSLADVEFCRALASDSKRLGALRRWLRLGGRLVVIAGSEDGAVLEEAGELGTLLPGTMAGTVATSETTALEQYADIGESEPIFRPGVRDELHVTRLADVTGIIELYAGSPPNALPLVVRGPSGLGEVTFVGVPLSSPPLAEWSGRRDFWRALVRPYLSKDETSTESARLGTLGYSDVSGALRNRLGSSFEGVATVSFSVVAILAILYILLLGPASYWIAHRFDNKPAIAWSLFPVLVMLTSGAAYWLGHKAKGDRPRVNELEIVDCDQTTGEARGTYWAVMYSPAAARFDLGLNVATPGAASASTTWDESKHEAETLFSWWGLAGAGIGGMQAGGIDLATIDASYRFSKQLDALEGMPILTSATKSLTGTWTTPIGRLIEGELQDDDGMLAGRLENRSGERLINGRLLYGSWAYRLGDLASDEQIEVGQHLAPIKTQTLVSQMALRNAATPSSNRKEFLVERATIDELLALMMFYRAAGGEDFARMPSRYQSSVDLSRLVELGRALLVAEVETGGTRLVSMDSGDPIDEAPRARRVTYRFVLPVRRSE